MLIETKIINVESNMFFFICHYRYIYSSRVFKTTVFKYNATNSFLRFFARCVCQNRCILVLTHSPPVKAIYCQNKRFFGLFGCARFPVMSYCQYTILLGFSAKSSCLILYME